MSTGCRWSIGRRESVEVSALADSGTVHLCIPEHLVIQLSLVELERREVVLGNQVQLGSIPMEDMDIVLRPQRQSVDVNPESPNIPLSLAKVGQSPAKRMERLEALWPGPCRTHYDVVHEKPFAHDPPG